MTGERPEQPDALSFLERLSLEGRVARLENELSLGATFWSRLVDFLAWDENWDGLGASKITMRTAMQAARAAELALKHAPEPFAAPAGDGSIMLEWELQNGAVVGVFIPGGGEEAWEPASVTRDDTAAEHDIHSAADLVDLLRWAAAEA